MPAAPKHTVYSCDAEPWGRQVPLLLEETGLGKVAAKQQRVLIKPNLVEILAPPITTPVHLISALIGYLLDYLPPSQICIGEGCGEPQYATHHVFHELGYTRLSQKYGIELIDLNSEELCRKTNSSCRRWPEMHLPLLLDNVFLLSVPQLKAHSLSSVTLTMKNMMGCVPPSHYKGNGAWNKAAFHTRIHEAIFDLNRYRTPDFTLLDATIGMARAHLWGPQCDPPVGKLAASFDPVAIDSFGTSLLKKNWQEIDHIVMANGVLGKAVDYIVTEI